MRRVWITGGRGFAGRHLVEEFDRRGTEVWVIDRVDGPEPSHAHTLRLDLADARAVADAVADTRPEGIVHLAAQSSGGLSFSIPGPTLRNNLESTLGLLEALREHGRGGPRLLAVGSCEEYGVPDGPEDLPLVESHALRPASPYAVSKAAQTLLVQQYRRAHGLDLLAVRSFTHTGPGQGDRFVFGSWARQVAERERAGGGVVRVGNLAVSRDVSDVRDVVRAYAELLDRPWPEDVVNLCSGRELRLEDALRILREAASAEIGVEVDPARLRPSDVPRFVGDPTRLRAWIGWSPDRPVEQTLRDLLDHWRARISPR